MTDSENNKYRMYLSTEKMLDENRAVWEGMAAMVEAKTIFSSNLIAISEYSAQREADGSGQTIVKGQNREDLENMILKMVGGMIGYTTSADLVAVRKTINYTPTRLNRAKDNELYDIATSLLEVATPYKTELVPFLIEDRDFETLDNLRNTFKNSIPAKRLVDGANTAAMKAMKLLFKETDMLLKEKIDNLLLTYRVPEPLFFTKYRAARVILDLGHGKRSGNKPAVSDNKAEVSGKVYDLETEEDVANAKVMLEGTSVWVMSDADGRYTLSAVPGSFRLIAEKTGFEAYSDDIVLESGDVLELDLGMEKTI